jgi:hypothetical protein
LPNGKIAKSTKNLERAVIAVQSFAFQCFIIIFYAVSFRFACGTLQRHGSDKLWECLTAACKAFSLANVKGMGTSDW